MQIFTGIPSVDSELSTVYGRLDSFYPEDVRLEVRADAEMSLDTMEQSGAQDEVAGLQSLRETLIADVQTRIEELSVSKTDASLGGLDIYRFISRDGLSIYLTKDRRGLKDHYPGFVRFAGVEISPVAPTGIPTLADYEAVPPELRFSEQFSFYRSQSGSEENKLTYSTDDQAYQYLLDRENLSFSEQIEKQQQKIDKDNDMKKTDLDFAISLAGISKVIRLSTVLSQRLIPFEYSAKMRAGMRLIKEWIPDTDQ